MGFEVVEGAKSDDAGVFFELESTFCEIHRYTELVSKVDTGICMLVCPLCEKVMANALSREDERVRKLFKEAKQS